MRISVELSHRLLRRIEEEATRRGVSAQDLCRDLLEASLPASDATSAHEFHEQMRLAREGMRRYRDTLHDLAQ